MSDLGDEFELFADEVAEWAELTLHAGLEHWPTWSDDCSKVYTCPHYPKCRQTC